MDPRFFKVPLEEDLSQIVCRACVQYQDEPYWYIEYYEGSIQINWTELPKEDIISLFGYDPFEEQPQPEPMSETDQAIVDTAINVEYLLALQELGLLVE